MRGAIAVDDAASTGFECNEDRLDILSGEITEPCGRRDEHVPGASGYAGGRRIIVD